VSSEPDPGLYQQLHRSGACQAGVAGAPAAHPSAHLPRRQARPDHDRGSAISGVTQAWGEASEQITHQLCFNAKL